MANIVPRILRQFTSNAKRELRCDCCGEEIGRGVKYLRQDLLDAQDNQKYIWRAHIACDSLTKWLPERYHREGFTKDEFISWVRDRIENRRCWGCPLFRDRERCSKIRGLQHCIPYIDSYFERYGSK